VKRSALIDHLHRHGCKFDREGARHTLFINPVTGTKALSRDTAKLTTGWR
jgi:hypothetical protein